MSQNVCTDEKLSQQTLVFNGSTNCPPEQAPQTLNTVAFVAKSNKRQICNNWTTYLDPDAHLWTEQRTSQDMQIMIEITIGWTSELQIASNGWCFWRHSGIWLSVAALLIKVYVSLKWGSPPSQLLLTLWVAVLRRHENKHKLYLNYLDILLICLR